LAAHSTLRVDGVEVALPQVDDDAAMAVGGITPELGGLEAHRIEVLRTLAGPEGERVRQVERAVRDGDPAAPATRVAGQASVPGWIAPRGQHAFSDREARLRADIAQTR